MVYSLNLQGLHLGNKLVAFIDHIKDHSTLMQLNLSNNLLGNWEET